MLCTKTVNNKATKKSPSTQSILFYATGVKVMWLQ